MSRACRRTVRAGDRVSLSIETQSRRSRGLAYKRKVYNPQSRWDRTRRATGRDPRPARLRVVMVRSTRVPSFRSLEAAVREKRLTFCPLVGEAQVDSFCLDTSMWRSAGWPFASTPQSTPGGQTLRLSPLKCVFYVYCQPPRALVGCLGRQTKITI